MDQAAAPAGLLVDDDHASGRAWYRFDSGGGSPWVARDAPGSYAVELPASAAPTQTTFYQITAYTSATVKCKVDSYLAGGIARVRCRDASGAFVDSRFTITWTVHNLLQQIAPTALATVGDTYPSGGSAPAITWTNDSSVSGDYAVTRRAAVADTWADRQPAVHLRLFAGPDPSVRAAATLRRHPGVPAEWRERCLTDPATRVNVARYVPLTAAQATELIGSGDLKVCRAVAANPELPAEAVEPLLELDDPQVRMAVAYSRHVDADTRDRLFALVAAEADAGSVAAYIALSWNFDEPGWLRAVPLAERLAYLDCPHAPFRRVLASCRDLPDAAWEQLDNDPDLRVRRYAAGRPDAPAAVLERLVRAGGAMLKSWPPIVEHPNFPRHRLRTFADDPDPQIRYVSLEDPDLPAEVLERLAVDSEAWIRRGAARHPNATPALLERLLADDAPEVVDEAAANPRLPLATMHRVLDESVL
ncbi:MULTISPECIES: hypothetical protein [unclassified Micromonospora]|uniref:hypothetical protein n=1 Tax=unclassified Micromonospora TaxID=2617518 RepID=UPI003A8A09F8